MYHTIIAVDVEEFGRRDAAHQRRIHEDLQPLVRKAVERCGLVWEKCYHEDRGDGLLVLAPPDAHSERLAECLPNELAGRLREHNHGAADGAHIRLRVVLHAGEVSRDAQGVAGPAMILAFRLLDAEELREALARSRGVLALITSAEFFRDVIACHPGANPGIYQQVRVARKETETFAWIGLPDNQVQSPVGRRRTGPPKRARRHVLDGWWVAVGVVVALTSALILWQVGWYLPHAAIAGGVVGVLGGLTATGVAALMASGLRSADAREQAG